MKGGNGKSWQQRKMNRKGGKWYLVGRGGMVGTEKEKKIELSIVRIVEG